MYKYWCSGGGFHIIKCQQKFFKIYLRTVSPKMHGKAKRQISHLNGESSSGELKGSGERHNHRLDSCIAVGAGRGPDVF